MCHTKQVKHILHVWAKIFYVFWSAECANNWPWKPKDETAVWKDYTEPFTSTKEIIKSQGNARYSWRGAESWVSKLFFTSDECYLAASWLLPPCVRAVVVEWAGKQTHGRSDASKKINKVGKLGNEKMRFMVFVSWWIHSKAQIKKVRPLRNLFRPFSLLNQALRCSFTTDIENQSHR